MPLLEAQRTTWPDVVMVVAFLLFALAVLAIFGWIWIKLS